ncbi:sensor histidine kinase [Novosphingobium sp. PhB165]|uniref:sensor histidine kinase n=1 Tax=Novosphingobium sp. PhB165 TaxID=2485105 RepID=UPI001404C5E5|nr:sensor histidine kinase [Novosphingobium sp. PhB165]
MQGWQHSFTGPREGAPAGVRSLAQTPDGILWIGASDGLYRYDGRSFARLPPSSAKPIQADTIGPLLATADGDLWVGHDYGGLSLVRSGRHVALTGLRMSTVWALPANRAGMAWAVGSDSRQVYIARLVNRKWVSWTEFKSDLFYGSAIGGDGTLWLLVGDRLIAISASDHRVRIVARGIRSSSLADGPDGRVWLVGKNRLTELGATEGADGKAFVIEGFSRKGDAPVRFEDARHFWIIQSDNVLERYEIGASGRAVRIAAWPSGYALTASVLPLSALPSMIDREQALWIGTSQGLERFSRSSFVSVLAGANNTVENRSPAFAAADGLGTVWAWRHDRLFRSGLGRGFTSWPGTRPSGVAPCAARSGGVWVFNGTDGFTRIGGPSPASLPLGQEGARLAKELGFNGCLEDARGRLWGAADRGLALLGSGRSAAVALGEDSGYSIGTYSAWRDGWVLAYIGNGNLWLTDGEHSRIVWRHDDNTLGFIEAQYRSGNATLLGGDRGLGRFDGRSVKVVSSARFPWLNFVAGIVQTPRGETWLQTSSGIVRLRTVDLDRTFVDPHFQPDVRIFRAADGVPGPPTYANISGLAADGSGRVWVSTSNGIAVFDPATAPADGPPPPVLVTAIEADDRVMPVGPRLELASGTGRLRIQLAVVDFDNPMATRLRYRLKGMDPEWVDASEQRAAMFTQLPPGHYRLEVMGANSHGVWNYKGQTIEIDVAPHFWQTWWFAVSAGLVLLLGLWLAVRWRIAQVARRLRSQAAERANERERIARDIHDTLLQGMQGLVMRIQAITSRMQIPDPNRQELEQSLDRADALIAEGKLRVHNLHLEDSPADLHAMLQQVMMEMPFAADVERSVSANGQARSVDVVVIREVREIVAEALFNAARHARAQSVSVYLTFGSRALEVLVADNGSGFENSMDAASGYGLVGMQKRAESIGARLTVETRPGEGTSVHMRVPGRRAYPVRMDLPAWLTR